MIPVARRAILRRLNISAFAPSACSKASSPPACGIPLNSPSHTLVLRDDHPFSPLVGTRPWKIDQNMQGCSGEQPEFMMPITVLSRKHFPKQVYDAVLEFLHAPSGSLSGPQGNVTRQRSALESLDYGCEDGLVAVELCRRGLRVTGVDPDVRVLARAQVRAAEQGAAMQVLGQAHARRSLPPSCMDLVTLMSCEDLHTGPAHVLREVHRLLRPGACLAVCWNDSDLSHPFMRAVEEVLEHQVQGYNRHDNQHGPDITRELLEQGGLFSLQAFSQHANPLLLSSSPSAGPPVAGLMAVLLQHVPPSLHGLLVHEVVDMVSRYQGQLRPPQEHARHGAAAWHMGPGRSCWGHGPKDLLLPLVSRLYLLTANK